MVGFVFYIFGGECNGVGAGSRSEAKADRKLVVVLLLQLSHVLCDSGMRRQARLT